MTAAARQLHCTHTHHLCTLPTGRVLRAGCTPLMCTATPTFRCSCCCTVSARGAGACCFCCWVGSQRRGGVALSAPPSALASDIATKHTTPCAACSACACLLCPTTHIRAVLQFLVSPLLLWKSFLSATVSYALYAAALSYYHYLNFLGFSALPFLERTEVRALGAEGRGSTRSSFLSGGPGCTWLVVVDARVHAPRNQLHA